MVEIEFSYSRKNDSVLDVSVELFFDLLNQMLIVSFRSD